jgi:transposase
MHERTNIQLSAIDRSALEAVVANRNSAQKHVWRAKIVLMTADGYGTAEIMRATGKAKTVIWRWQERFRDEGAAGLWRDKTRPSRIPPLSPAVAERVVAMTLAGPPPAASHWTGAAMAKAAGISVSSVQRIWRSHGLRPHLVRRFKLSNDPQFAAKLEEIVGLYGEVVLTATVAIPGKIEVVASQPIHLLNNPMISALANVLKCKLKPTTAADVSAFTSSLRS